MRGGCFAATAALTERVCATDRLSHNLHLALKFRVGDRYTMPEIAYVLTNEAMPGLIKIGLTTDSVEARLTNLSAHTGIPLPFECYFAAEVKDAVRIEKTLHQRFAEARINPKGEFFRLDPEKVVLAISIGEFREVTPGAAQVEPAEQEALAKAKAKRPRIRLDAIGIKPGDELVFSRDEAIRAVVAANDKVVYEGETLSLSAAALKALHKLGYKTPAASGSEHWMFDGELLDERRRRLEDEPFGQAAPADERGRPDLAPQQTSAAAPCFRPGDPVLSGDGSAVLGRLAAESLTDGH